MDKVPPTDIQKWEKAYLEHLRADHAELLETIQDVDKKWTKELAAQFDEISAKFVAEITGLIVQRFSPQAPSQTSPWRTSKNCADASSPSPTSAKITKAMEMVASMKLRKVQAKAAIQLRPTPPRFTAWSNHLQDGSSAKSRDAACSQHAKSRRLGIFLVSSDRGLCGAYNSNVFGQASQVRRSAKTADPRREVQALRLRQEGLRLLRPSAATRSSASSSSRPWTRLNFNAAKMVAEELTDAFTRRNRRRGRTALLGVHRMVKLHPDRFANRSCRCSPSHWAATTTRSRGKPKPRR